MHLMDDKPAYYVEGEQIVFAHKYVERLCDSLEQLRRERKKSDEWTIKGFERDSIRYDYIKVVIDDG